MNLQKIQKARERRAISPIIATLLLILIAIAAGVVVYAYVIGFVGTTTSGGGQPTTQLSLDSSSYTKGGSGNLNLFVRNVGGSTATISAIYVTGPGITGTVQLSTPADTIGSCTTVNKFCSTSGSSTINVASTLQVQASSTELGSVTIASGTYTVTVVTSDGASFPFNINVK